MKTSLSVPRWVIHIYQEFRLYESMNIFPLWFRVDLQFHIMIAVSWQCSDPHVLFVVCLVVMMLLRTPSLHSSSLPQLREALTAQLQRQVKYRAAWRIDSNQLPWCERVSLWRVISCFKNWNVNIIGFKWIDATLSMYGSWKTVFDFSGGESFTFQLSCLIWGQCLSCAPPRRRLNALQILFNPLTIFYHRCFAVVGKKPYSS